MKSIQRIFTDPIDRRIETGIEQRISSLDLTPMNRCLNEDIFIAGYPKSGNTWFQNLIVGIYFGVDTDLAPDTLIQELVPDVHFRKYYRRYKTPTFFKTHSLPRPEYKRVVYLVRDGRDAVVSYYHHERAIKGDHLNWMDIVRDDAVLFPCKWHEHVQEWHANPYHADKIIIKYEDLKQNPLKELTRFCEFAGIERDPVFIQQVIDRAAFSRLQAKETEGRMYFASPKWPDHKHFFRRGVVGSYRDEMPSDALETFLGYSSETLKQMGYL